MLFVRRHDVVVRESASQPGGWGLILGTVKNFNSNLVVECIFFVFALSCVAVGGDPATCRPQLYVVK